MVPWVPTVTQDGPTGPTTRGDGIAAGLPRALTDEVRRLDEHQLRRLMILARGLLVGVEGPLGPVDEQNAPLHVSYRQEHVRCGGDGCTGCPHGPYWYGYFKQDGRTRKQYIGRSLPGEALEPVDPQQGVRPARGGGGSA